MKKIWITIIIFLFIIVGGILYNNYLIAKTDYMINMAERAYEMVIIKDDGADKYLEKIDEELDKISALLCAFLDRDIIDEAQDAVVYARETLKAKSGESACAIEMMKEKINHIKNTAKIELKYIL